MRFVVAGKKGGKIEIYFVSIDVTQGAWGINCGASLHLNWFDVEWEEIKESNWVVKFFEVDSCFSNDGNFPMFRIISSFKLYKVWSFVIVIRWIRFFVDNSWNDEMLVNVLQICTFRWAFNNLTSERNSRLRVLLRLSNSSPKKACFPRAV